MAKQIVAWSAPSQSSSAPSARRCHQNWGVSRQRPPSQKRTSGLPTGSLSELEASFAAIQRSTLFIDGKPLATALPEGALARGLLCPCMPTGSKLDADGGAILNAD